MRGLTAAMIGAGAATLAGTTYAQTLDDPEAVPVEELVVQAREPGPAWWRVSDGDTTVYVLGVPDMLPKGLKWNQSTLTKRLTGAHTVITPAEFRYTGKLTEIPGLINQVRKAGRANKDRPLPPELAGPLADAASKTGRDPAYYAAMQPWLAGVRLVDDYRKRGKLTAAEPERAILKQVKAQKLKPQPAVVVSRRAKDDVAKLLWDTPEPVARECLEGAISEVRAGDGAARRAAEAWAAGDVRGALTAPRGSERCLIAVPGAADARRDLLLAQARAIEGALQKPGHAVAILPLRAVLSDEGVLQRLKKRGYAVRTPDRD